MTHLFRRFGLLTVTAIIGLIFVGGFVRATGAGMGCPDWPKCFGLWVPPTSIEQLPENYQEIFGAKLKGEVVFNATKTWIEYINRLFGVLVGLFIIISTFLAYRAYRNNKIIIFYYSFGALVLVIFEGWLGSKVVSTELNPLMITVHMLVSVVILGFLLYAVLLSYKQENLLVDIPSDKSLVFLLMLTIFLMIGQILFGTQIREGIDMAQKTLGDYQREKWIFEVEGKVWFHGGLALLICIIQYFILKKTFTLKNGLLSKIALYTFVFVVLSLISGGVLSFFKFPAFAQPLHLVFSSIIISFQFGHLFLLKN